MPLRTRLTLWYTLLMAGVLILSGVVIFANVSLLMIQNVDRDLKDTAQIMLADLQTEPEGKIVLQELAVKSALKHTFFQVWGMDEKLQISYPPILAVSLDENGRTTQSILLEFVNSPMARLRVLSQPIIISQTKVGILQIAINLNQLTETQNNLLFVLLIAIVLGTALTSIISWMVTDRVLHPLEDVVNTASQISRVDDLARRIPVKSKRNDEVGVLIKAMNQTFERLERLFISQQRFLADVSHDLRTPLTIIKGNAELMRKTGKADEESLDSIDQEVNHLTRMVLDLLLLVQAESGQLPLERKPVRLDEVIDDVVKRLRPLAARKLQLVWEGTSETWVQGDAFRLKQVFDNLISNAIKFTPKNGTVTVVMTKTGKDARVSIKDTGPGISTKYLPHIFERFFRVEPSRPRGKEAGFGLGLAISNWIIKQHRGEIRVKSKVGIGTTFTVRLNRYKKGK